MSPDAIFQFASTIVLPQWLLMIVAPRWQVTQWLVKSYLIPVILGVLYAIYIFGNGPIDFSSFGTLAGVKNLFSTGGDSVMLAGWIHYLAFDLVTGAFVLRDSQQHKISHWFVIVPLFFCFMLGPIGLLLYWIIRLFYTRKLSV